MNDNQASKHNGIKPSSSRFIKNVGNYQTRVLLIFIYFILILPFALGVRIFGDPLLTRQPPSDTGWVNRLAQETSTDTVERQF